MKPWQAIAAIVPAGLLLGMAGGHASYPEMQFHEARPWPASAEEHGQRIEAWQPIYEAGPENPSPAAYSYRPDMDYSAFAAPPQEAVYDVADIAGPPAYGEEPVSVEARYSEGRPDLPNVQRAATEEIADRALAAAGDATAAAHETAMARVGTAPEPVAPIETEAF